MKASEIVGSSSPRMEEMDENRENIFMFVHHRSQTKEKPFKDRAYFTPLAGWVGLPFDYTVQSMACRKQKR